MSSPFLPMIWDTWIKYVGCSSNINLYLSGHPTGGGLCYDEGRLSRHVDYVQLCQCVNVCLGVFLCMHAYLQADMFAVESANS